MASRRCPSGIPVIPRTSTRSHPSRVPKSVPCYSSEHSFEPLNKLHHFRELLEQHTYKLADHHGMYAHCPVVLMPLGEISAKSHPNLPCGDVLSSGGGVARGIRTVECIVASREDYY